MAEKMVYTLSSNITLEEFVDDPKCCVINRIGEHAKSLDVLRDIEEILSKRQWHARIVYQTIVNSIFGIYIYDKQDIVMYMDSAYIKDHDYDEAKTFYSLLCNSYDSYLKDKGDEKYSVALSLRICLVSYSEDKKYINGLLEKFTESLSHKFVLDKLEEKLNERGWCAEIHYHKCPTPIKRIVIDKFYMKVYDGFSNMKFKVTQRIVNDNSDSIDLLLRKCYEELANKVYTSTASGYVDYNRISLHKEYLENDVNATIETYRRIIKEEENMLPKSVKEAFDPFYFNSSDFCTGTEPAQVYKDRERHKEICAMEMLLGIQNVKFNDPATIVFWDDGTKTVVKCQKGDKFDPEKGLAMAIVKKKVGSNNGYFNKIFEKWCPDEEPENVDIPKETKRPKVFTETAEEYSEEVKKQKKIGDGYDDIHWETNGRIIRK